MFYVLCSSDIYGFSGLRNRVYSVRVMEEQQV